MENPKRKIRCKGCDVSFSSALLHLFHVKKDQTCQEAYGRNGYQKLLKLTSKNTDEDQDDFISEEQPKRKKVINNPKTNDHL